MIIFSILYGTLVVVYFWLLMRLQGSWKDRFVVILFRSLVLIGVALLLFSPRFESIHKEWKDPVFLVLMDDSASVRLVSDSASDRERLIRELSSKGRVLFKRFSDLGVSDPYSINSNLLDSLKIKELRSVFLFSDGQEINKRKLNTFSVPIFPIPIGLMKTKDYWVSLDQVPQKINLGQKVLIRGSVGRSGDLIKLAPKMVKIRFIVENLGVAEQIIKLNSKQRQIEFEQEIHFDKPGEVLVGVELEVTDEDAIDLNNRSQFKIQVQKKRRKVVLVSNEIGHDQAFYLRILRRNPALDVQSFYTRAKYPLIQDDSCARLENAELLILHTLDDSFFSECIEARYSEVPRIHLVDLHSINVYKKQLGNFIDLETIIKSSTKQSDWSYRLDSKRFPALKLYEHEAFKRTLLSSLPEIQAPPIEFRSKAGVIDPFFMQRGEEKAPLLLVDEASDPVRALFTSTGLHRTRFAPWTRAEQQSFMVSLFQRLVSWMMDYDKVRDLSIFVPKTSFSEGEMFVMELDGGPGVRWDIRRIDQGSEILHRGTSPVRFKQNLPVGNYRLTLYRSGTEILRRSIHVNFDTREFENLGVDVQKLRNLASISDGKWIERDGQVDVHTVLDGLPGNLLQKKLELKRSQVDLQKNTYLAFFLMLLLSLEWGYRLLRKMV